MSNELNQLVEQRLTKLERFKERGELPYPPRVKRTHSLAEAFSAFEDYEARLKNLAETAEAPPAPTVNVVGRLIAIRVMGRSSFAHLEDSSGKLQLFLSEKDVGKAEYKIFKKDFDLGDFIAVEGYLFRTRTGEVTVHVTSYQLAAKTLHPLPEKWHGLQDTELRYRQRYLDLIANEAVRDIFIKRSQIISQMRRFMEEQGFLEVETPALQPTYGGAMARPFTTYHNALDTTLYLRIADELYLKRLIVGGMDKVFEICKDFRNEGVSTKHNPEFTMMECYWAYADYEDMMWLTETMIAHIATTIHGSPQVTYGNHELDFTPPWTRISLAEAIRQYAGVDIDALTDLDSLWAACQSAGLKVAPQPTWGKLVDELFGEFVEPALIQPTFVHTYPVDISPLSKQSPDNPRVVERFEAVVANMEIGNAYSELNDPLLQRERFESQRTQHQAGDEEAHPIDEDYVTALMYGMPPTGGLGIGVDRLVMLLTNQDSIREVILFPAMKPKATNEG